MSFLPGSEKRDLSDIHLGDWVDRYLPSAWRPFTRLARLDRPVGVWLTLLPCFAALFQASGGMADLSLLVIFSLGALVMRAAGSTINDLADRNFDGHVERTRFRPLACGQIGVSGAMVFLGFELLLASALLFFLSPFTRLVALCVLPLVVIYPFCKRFTYWPQAVLGAAFNWGMLMAWAQVQGHIPFGAVLMWGGAIAWQIGYDTVYAYVDVRDDRQLGLKSTAILFGVQGRLWIGVFYALALILWSVGGWMLGANWYYAAGMAVVGLHLAWQIRTISLERPEVSFRLFVSNILTGLLLALAALAGS